MLNISDVLNKVDIYKLLEHYEFESMREDGKFIRSACKIHDGDNPTSFVINTEDSLWYCHTGCGGGDAITLVEKMEDITFVEAIKWLANFAGIDVTQVDFEKREEEMRRELRQWMDLHKRINANSEIKECSLVIEAHPLAKLRDFKRETLEHFNVGYVDKLHLINKSGEAYDLYERIHIPIYFNDMYVGFSLRRVNEQDIMKWSHQPRDFNVARILYNYDNVKDEDEIVVVEGMFDVYAFHEIGVPAVCTFGSHLSEEQEKLLLRTGADITFAYDNDNAGITAKRKAAKRLNGKAMMRQLELPIGEDPESISREELTKIHSARKRLFKEA